MEREQGSGLSCHVDQPSWSGRDSLQRGQDCFLDTRPSLSSRDSSPGSAHDDLTNGDATTERTPPKRRCGRPRVYDLDRPVDSGEVLELFAADLVASDVCCSVDYIYC